MQRRVARREIYLLLGTIVLAAMAALILLARPISGRVAKPRPNLELRVAEQDGRLRIDWDPSDPIVRDAEGATLEVNDGGMSNRYPLESKVLRSGGLDYIRRSEDVLMRITLTEDGAPGAQASVLRISPVNFSVADTSPSPAKPQPQRASRATRARRR